MGDCVLSLVWIVNGTMADLPREHAAHIERTRLAVPVERSGTTTIDINSEPGSERRRSA